MDESRLTGEEAKIKALRRLVDDCARKLAETDMSDEEAQALIESVRGKVLELFPGKDEQFELIYRTRFERIIRENRDRKSAL